MLNRLANVNDTVIGVRIGRESITSGSEHQLYQTGKMGNDENGECLAFPLNGYFKRENERFVLPHAIGCQSPVLNLEYALVLKEGV